MRRLDTVFEVAYGHSLELNRLTQITGGVNFVSRTEKNNGVAALVNMIQGLEPSAAGSLTVALGGSVLATYVQPRPFYTGFHVAILTPIDLAMNEMERLWWATVISANRYRYSFGRQANRTLAGLMVPDAAPAWIHETALPDVSSIAAPSSSPIPLADHSTWGQFKLSNLFNVLKGTRLTKAQMLPGSNPYIGASEYSNGVTGWVGNAVQFPGGVISVPYNGSVAHAFYQPEKFLAGDDVHVLDPIQGKGPESQEASLFVATVLRLEKPKYNYGRKWGLDKMRDAVIRLPQDPDGNPDWSYMEAFMRGLPLSASVA